MIDINTILTQALTIAVNNAVEAATKPLIERISMLESSTGWGWWDRDTIVERIAALEAAQAAQAEEPTAHAIYCATNTVLEGLDQKEWFWNTVATFVAKEVSSHDFGLEQQVSDAIESALENHDFGLEEQVSDAVREAISDYDFSSEISDALDNYDLEDTITETVKEMTFRLE